jgi:hypothetical protein
LYLTFFDYHIFTNLSKFRLIENEKLWKSKL